MKKAGSSIKVLVVSSDDRDSLVAEVWIGDNLFAEVYEEDQKRRIIVFSVPQPAGYWDLSFAEVSESLSKAASALWGGPSST